MHQAFGVYTVVSALSLCRDGAPSTPLTGWSQTAHVASSVLSSQIISVGIICDVLLALSRPAAFPRWDARTAQVFAVLGR
jgi:hypothetical protein